MGKPGRPPKNDRLLTPKQAGELLGLEPKTLQHWRTERRGPPYVKLSEGQRGHIRYRESDILAFMRSLQVIEPQR